MKEPLDRSIKNILFTIDYVFFRTSACWSLGLTSQKVSTYCLIIQNVMSVSNSEETKHLLTHSISEFIQLAGNNRLFHLKIVILFCIFNV